MISGILGIIGVTITSYAISCMVVLKNAKKEAKLDEEMIKLLKENGYTSLEEWRDKNASS